MKMDDRTEDREKEEQAAPQEQNKTEHTIDGLLAKLSETGGYDLEKIKKAYAVAEEYHRGQVRRSGEPYIIHPIAVAEIVAELQLDTDSICAAFLHDVVEDCPGDDNLAMIRREFGAEVAEIVDGVTKLVHIPFETKQEESIENLRKMFLAMSKDLRVIFINLADRRHNMRTINYRSAAHQRSVALATMPVYAPPPHRLVIQKKTRAREKRALGSSSSVA